jgi:hypothetical protein
MKTATRHKSREADIWLRIMHPKGKLTRQSARAILDLAFPPKEIARSRELLVKARAGTLTPEEDLEMDDILRADAILSILKSKARMTLKQPAKRA